MCECVVVLWLLSKHTHTHTHPHSPLRWSTCEDATRWAIVGGGDYLCYTANFLMDTEFLFYIKCFFIKNLISFRLKQIVINLVTKSAILVAI